MTTGGAYNTLSLDKCEMFRSSLPLILGNWSRRNIGKNNNNKGVSLAHGQSETETHDPHIATLPPLDSELINYPGTWRFQSEIVEKCC